ncbi:MAG: tetratricopeptide repeat protein [Lachnospiraceae bacterium]|nr:tetratricopeptide repeat protein [Lachnospiraceae bacterium]
MKLGIRFAAAAGCLALLLTGCGKAGAGENIDQGMAAIEALDYEGALAFFEKALVENEDKELLYRGQGIAYIGLTQYEEAAEALEKSLSSCSGFVGDLEFDTNYYLAAAYYKSGNIDGAAQVYDAILGMRDTEKDAYYLRGALELEKEDFDRAKADFDKAIALDPKDYDCLLDIYQSLERSGYREAGEEYLQTALTEGGDSISDYDRGRLYYYLRDYDNAKNSLEKARDTGSAEAVLFLGRTYEALGDFNYASSVYANYLESDPDTPEIQNQLGICKMQMGDYEAALEAFASGLACEDKTYMQTLKYNEIAAYEHLSQFKKATVLMESYLQSYPDDEKAKREYEFLKTR